MPQAVPIVQAVVGFIAGSSLGAFVTRALLTTAFSVGVNAIFGRKPETPQFDQGINFGLQVDPTYARTVVYGVAKTGGSLVYADETTATDTNDTLWMVIALADHECEGVQEIQVNGSAITWNSGTGVVSEFTDSGTDHLKIHFYDGAESQTADAALVAASTPWTTSHRGRGVCYIIIEALFKSELFSQIPQVEVVLKGKKLYDRRLDSTETGGSGSHRSNDPTTWEWENSGTVLGDNPALQLDDYMRGLKTAGGEVIGGLGMDAADISTAEAQTAATDCEDSITTITPSGTEKRYRSGLVLSTSATHKSNIRAILATMAGELHDHGGKFRMFAGKARTSVLTITDDDVVREVMNGQQRIPKKWTWEPQAGRESRINLVRGRFVDETNGWRAEEYPTQDSATYKTEDGGKELAGNLDLLGVPSHSQAQRLAKIYLERSRYFGQLVSTFQPALIELESGDWLTYDSTRQGWTGGSTRTFEVEASTEYPDTMVELKLQEVASSIYTWTPGTDEVTPAGATAPTTPAQGDAYAGQFKTLAYQDTASWDTDVSSRPTWSTDDRVPDTITDSEELARTTKIVQLSSGTTQRSLGRAVEWLEVQDGDSVTFASNFGTPPKVRILGGSGLSFAVADGSDFGDSNNQYQSYTATNITTSGFDVSAKVRQAPTATQRNDTVATTGTGSEPDLVGHKSTADEAVDDTYRFTGTVSATFTGPAICTIGVYTLDSGTSTWVQRATTTVSLVSGSSVAWSADAVVDGLTQDGGGDQEFGVSIESQSGTFTVDPALASVSVAYNSASSVVNTSATPNDPGETFSSTYVFALVFESDEVLT
jgi:co-chaperonin GroES (HSP10)